MSELTKERVEKIMRITPHYEVAALCRDWLAQQAEIERLKAQAGGLVKCPRCKQFSQFKWHDQCSQYNDKYWECLTCHSTFEERPGHADEEEVFNNLSRAIKAAQLSQQADNARLQAEIERLKNGRCLMTGNPCGTDTRPVDDPCQCASCVVWAGICDQRIARLQRELVSAQEAIGLLRELEMRSQKLEQKLRDERDQLKRELAEERGRMDWWEEHLNYEHGTDYETGEVVLYKVTGNINDREWHEIARACNLREALCAAIDAAKHEGGK